jgi:glutathione S-transferase
MRALWTLEELGEPYELVVMSRELGRSDPDHLGRHPLGRVPVLETDEGLVFESAAICLHLADSHPEAGLAPAVGTYQRALLYQWTVFAPAELEPALFDAWFLAEKDPERAAAARKTFDVAVAAVATALDDREYLIDDAFSVADVLVGTTLGFTARAGFADELPQALQAYVARLAQRPAFQRASARLTA